ncbi:hypothetical protein GCM10022240_30170 [Microbacterium kribbense]|uniref:Uncharacterized protein n=1 Tax=Microbacterium kribbense TaxID=433645 RepID=A0ABP7H252_9MICO
MGVVGKHPRCTIIVIRDIVLMTAVTLDSEPLLTIERHVARETGRAHTVPTTEQDPARSRTIDSRCW